MVPSTSQVPQPLPRVLYSLHIDDEEPISCRSEDSRQRGGHGPDQITPRDALADENQQQLPGGCSLESGDGYARRIFPTMVHEAHRSGNGVAKAEPVMIEAKKSRSPIAILQ